MLKNIFLRFSSSKEIIQYYKVENEDGGLKCICNEKDVGHKETKYRFYYGPLSHIDAVKEGMKLRVEKIGYSGFNIPFGC